MEVSMKEATTGMANAGDDKHIDESLYSRQL
jgi:hypothetical protein